MRLSYKEIKDKLYNIIFEADTPEGRAFDIVLIISILLNNLLIIIESVEHVRVYYGPWLMALGYFFLVIFTFEYLLRIIVAKKVNHYMLSFFGIIDLLAILPVFIGFFLPEARLLVVVRIFRLLRLFSIMKMGRYIEESGHLIRALRASRPKITIFLFTILFIIVIVGSMMYMIEGPENGFKSIPESMYWAIVTVSTVGYGDISPQTSLGKLVSSLLMIIGYSILAVPTGIISHELAHTSKDNTTKGKVCIQCGSEAHTSEDKYCASCGTSLGK